MPARAGTRVSPRAGPSSLSHPGVILFTHFTKFKTIHVRETLGGHEGTRWAQRRDTRMEKERGLGALDRFVHLEDASRLKSRAHAWMTRCVNISGMPGILHLV